MNLPRDPNSVLPVLMYHGLDSIEHPYRCMHEDELYYVLDVKTFRAHMNILVSEGIQPILIRDIPAVHGSSAWRDNKYVVLTFDDGHESNFQTAMPVLEEHGFPAEFFITSGWIDTPHYMSSTELRELTRLGMSVQSHAVSHAFLTEVDDAQLRSELLDSRNRISEITQEEVRFISYPGGRFSPTVSREALRCGYSGSCTSVPGYNDWSTDLFHLRRYGISISTTDPYFRALVCRDWGYLFRQKAKHLLGQAVRGTFGESAYRKIQSKIRAAHDSNDK
jgi:peptidoglycan/xylan/chitin deacetylase (PgdA/CDA1 family)